MSKIITKNLPSQVKAETWQQYVEHALKTARRLGASAAEASVGTSTGLSVNVRLGEIDTLEFDRDQSFGITVYFGKRKGSVTSSDLTPEAMAQAVQAACDAAKLSNEDPAAGLADPQLLAGDDWPDLMLAHPWSLTVDDAIALATECETIGRKHHPEIDNSEGAAVNSHHSFFVYGNSDGFLGGYPSTRHSLSCTLIAKRDGQMQRDYAYTSQRDPKKLLSVEAIAQEAAERSVARLGARRLSTQEAPVLFEARLARSMLGDFLSAIQGHALYRKSSFLLDHIHKPVFAPWVDIVEDPLIPNSIGGIPFDSEGVRTKKQVWIKKGILQSYRLDSYAARKLGLTTTGHAGSMGNITFTPNAEKLPELLRQMQRGLLVTELMGDSTNIVTGDYSCGASGFWVENGTIQYPVEEITIAGTLQDLFRNIVAAGSDMDTQGRLQTGSLLFEKMRIGGE